ncbi:MAG: hypothetical protein O3B13_03480 [Planctomycetota bacterium]|nr:hypothetical protein [Planctomycetota bacterium]
MKLLFVADGPRDAASLPGLVRSILEREIQAEFTQWAHLRTGGRGYERKLKFAAAQTRSRGLNGLIAVVDQDRDRRNERRKSLTNARQELADSGKFVAIAVGVAIPHVDAWLLDDVAAVRTGLHLPVETVIPSAGKAKYPKDDLDQLIQQSDFKEVSKALESISAQVQEGRCQNADKTGFRDFATDCRRELK